MSKELKKKLERLKETEEGLEGKIYWLDVLGGQRVAYGDLQDYPRDELMATCIDYGNMVWNKEAETVILIQGIVQNNPLCDDDISEPNRGCVKIIPVELIKDIKFMVEE